MNLHRNRIRVVAATTLLFACLTRSGIAVEPDGASPLGDGIAVPLDVLTSDESISTETMSQPTMSQPSPSDIDDVSVKDLLDMATTRYENLSRQSPEIQSKWNDRREDTLTKLKRLIQDPKFVAELKKVEQELLSQAEAKRQSQLNEIGMSEPMQSEPMQSEPGKGESGNRRPSESSETERAGTPSETQRPTSDPVLRRIEPSPHGEPDAHAPSFVRSGQALLPYVAAKSSVDGGQAPIDVAPADSTRADNDKIVEHSQTESGNAGQRTSVDSAMLKRLIEKLRELDAMASELDFQPSHSQPSH
ncbi:hypothetical protein [Stieleria varia]|uniref:Secreted protein n=1 Tax=Stieleria varia TaxID=2528005 RepID=A0A5C6B6M1_9BACT|nr:hypothetical protein [Stieleria varia]TWU07598.1 hypothetical protein Pla52n_01710 [Stieleria varia]